MLDVEIKTIDHKDQRYPTVGDWQELSPKSVSISVSNLKNWRMEAAVAVHELIEYLLCRHHSVPQVFVDDFDRRYEANRPKRDVSEPGDDPRAPYSREHCFATGIERLLIAEFGIKWTDYENAINSI